MDIPRTQDSTDKLVGNAQPASGDNLQGDNTTQNDNLKGNDSFFTIPDNVKSQLSPEAIGLMNQVGKNWLSENTKRRQAETAELRNMEQQVASLQQKSDMLDGLMNDPQFTNTLVDAHNRRRGIEPQSPIPNNNGQSAFDNFDNPEALSALTDAVAAKVEGNLRGVIAPFMQDMAVNREQAEINQIKSFVESERAAGKSLPDVDEATLKLTMRKYNMPAMEAYRLNAAPFLMTARKPVIDTLSLGLDNQTGQDQQQDNSQQQQANAASSQATIPPGSGSTQDVAVLPSTMSVDDKFAAADKLRNKKDGPTTMQTADVVGEVLKAYNVKAGGGFTL